MIKSAASFTVILVRDLTAAKAYDIGHLSFSVVFETDWYIHLSTATGIQVGFMRAGTPEMPAIFQDAHKGTSVILSFETKDVDTAFAYVQKPGLLVVAPIKSEDWGQRHFILQDPNGILVDVIHNIQPSHEYVGEA